ncbi:MAG: DUF2384 domain-containing protein [Thiothrix sp.]|nr:DUF2384 domain-containing protein [Thiothrix sp.]HPE60050.1 DUF2384 domain-containing protein [Thiolinea sp.]
MTDLSDDELRLLGQVVIRHLDDWELDGEQTLRLLGLENELRPRQLVAVRHGDRLLPRNADLMVRIDHLVGIADALRTTFPFSSQMRLLWLRKPHRRFQRRQPLDVMLEGLNGLTKVRVEVDCSYGYAINDALHARQQAQDAAR